MHVSWGPGHCPQKGGTRQSLCIQSQSFSCQLKMLGWTLFGVDTHRYPLVDRQSLGCAPTRALSLGLEQQNLSHQFRISESAAPAFSAFVTALGYEQAQPASPAGVLLDSLSPKPPRRRVHGGTYSLLGGQDAVFMLTNWRM